VLLVSHSVNKAILVAQFLRDRAWWRLDSAGASAPRVARSVVPRQAPALETTPEPVGRG